MLSIKTLGRLSIALDDTPVAGFASRKAEALLVYLACTGREHPREVLAELLWDDRPQRQAMANLRVVLSSLRKQIGPYVAITRTTAGLNPDADVWLDVAQLEDAAPSLDGPQDASSTAAAGSLGVALRYYDGDFLAGFFLPEASAFESWAAAERERLHRLAVSGMHFLGRWHLARDEHQQAIHWATRLVTVDELIESGRRQLMQALALSGRRTEALRQYEVTRQVLQDELGILPSEETNELYEAIRTGALRSQAVAAETGQGFEPPQEKPDLPAHNLPTQLTPFIGREDELSQLDALLTASRLVTIAGLGGMGKTRLALAWAERQLASGANGVARFPDGVFLVSLAAIDDAAHIVPAVADAVNFPLQGRDPRAPEQQLLDFLARKRLLLIMDNFEQLLAGAEFLAQILKTAPDVVLLVTSREPLRMRGEQLFALGGLAFTANHSGADIVSSPAGRLFLRTARRTRPAFALSEGDAAHLSQVCRLVGGMPLGLELAAGWIDILSLRGIAGEIRQSLDFLEADAGVVLDRQRSMRAVFDATWDRLQPDEHDVFSQLCLFRGGFTRDAAQTVTGTSLRLLARLVGKALLSYRRNLDRYEIHELLRQYGAEKLSPESEAEVRDRHCRYYTGLLAQKAEELKGPGQLQAANDVDLDFENCRLAWHWSVDRSSLERLAQSLEGLGLYLFDWRGRFQEGERLCHLAAGAPSMAEFPEGRRLLIRLLSWQAAFCAELGRLEQADQLSQQCLELLEYEPVAALHNWPGKAAALRRMAWQVWRTDQGKGHELCQKSLLLAQEYNDRWQEAKALRLLGDMAYNLAGFDEGARLYQESLALDRKLGDRVSIADGLDRLASCAWDRSRYDDAEAMSLEMLEISRQLGLRAIEARAIESLSWVHLQRAQYERALALDERLLTMYEDLGQRVQIARTWFRSSVSLVDSGRYQEGQALAEKSLALARELGDEITTALPTEFLGRVALAQGDFVHAERLFRESARIFRVTAGSGHPDSLSILLCQQSMALIGLGQMGAARQLLVEALQIFDKTHSWKSVYAAMSAALLFLEQGEAKLALEWWAMARQDAGIASAPYFEDIVGHRMAAAAGNLPAEIAASAEERGRAHSLASAPAALLVDLEKLGLLEDRQTDVVKNQDSDSISAQTI